MPNTTPSPVSKSRRARVPWTTWTIAAASLTVIVAFQNCSSHALDKAPLDVGGGTQAVRSSFSTSTTR